MCLPASPGSSCFTPRVVCPKEATCCNYGRGGNPSVSGMNLMSFCVSMMVDDEEAYYGAPRGCGERAGITCWWV